MKYLKVFEDEEVVFAFTTKNAGNMSYARADNKEDVTRRLNELASDFNIVIERIIRLNQVHGTEIMLADREGARDSSADGLITNKEGYCLATSHADCIPLYFYDPENMAIGLVHSGWKGTLGGIPRLMVDRMGLEYGTKPASLRVIIGPGISKEFFEVKDDVSSLFSKEFPGYGEFIEEDRIDLKALVKAMLIDKGIKEEKITDMNLCTYKEEGLFFSHRRATKRGERLCGTMLALAFIKEDL